ncbi:MAG: acetate--CoA ligase family protein [Spirochaetes bacterium]|nr:acetate--CoA ligase family protein [Spirochaetota bacterium]
MEKLFYPESLVIMGLSSKPNNIPKLVLENLIRWGFKGRILGVNPRSEDHDVNGIRMYKNIRDLPIVPDLVFALVPAKLIPAVVDECGEIGVKWMAIPSGGFNELSEDGAKLADLLLEKSSKYGIRFVGPNGLTVANTANGLCLPFVPSFPPPRGGFSIIAQSGGVGLMLWNFMMDENIGMAKFASIGNKLDLDEVDFLEYFGSDPDTKIIGMYLESITRGKELLAAAAKIDKPIVILKSNTTSAGQKAAMSHTAALSNDDKIIDAAFDRAGIIRISHFNDFISVAKAFELPPMRGNRLMMMSPAGGITVMMADLCEKIGFKFADPGRDFFDGLKGFSNAGVINFSNPLDMGDIYDPHLYAKIFYEVMHNDNIDGGVFVTQWPQMPRGQDVFYKMFHTDLSKEATGTMLSSGKPLGVCIFGLSATIATMKKNINFPLFDSFEDMMFAMKKQCDYYMRKENQPSVPVIIDSADCDAAAGWINAHPGDTGEESMDLLTAFGISTAGSALAATADEAAAYAQKIGHPVVLKVVSPDALHKSEAGGVLVGLHDNAAVKNGFKTIRENLSGYNKKARFDGVRVAKMAGEGYDMFIGGRQDASFGPVIFFGFGGIYIEIFNDVRLLLCPAGRDDIQKKVTELKSYGILKGARGKQPVDIDSYIAMIERVSHLLVRFPEIQELDMNPVRILADGSGSLALDARIRIQ